MLNFLPQVAPAQGALRGMALLVLALHASGQTNQPVYTDSLQNDWASWGWAALNFANTPPVHMGTYSISVSSTNWQALYLHHSPQSGSAFTGLSFWINGGSSGGQVVQVQATRNGVAQSPAVLPALPVSSWRQETIPLSTLGVANVTDFDGFWIQVQDSGLAPMFYVDDIALVTNLVVPPTVVLTSPVPAASYLVPASIPLAATVTTNGHVINQVQFYSSTNLLGSDLSPPYNYTWTNVGIGGYTLKARVVFDFGTASAGTADSEPVGITVVSNVTVAITINAQLNQHPISPLIYGVAFASSNQLLELNAPLNRSGGNAESRYNWQLNAHNRAADWYFESLEDSSSVPGAAADDHIAQSMAGGAYAILTVPMIGWVPKLGPNRERLCSFAISRYGLQTDHDWQWFPDAGNGVVTNTTSYITTNNPNDANFLTNSAFQQAWMQHLTNAWGLATNGGVRYYCLDNEHTLWSSTHRDVHPVGATMQEIRDKLFDYGSKVKAIDPSAWLVAPEEWGWPGYLYSGYDWQWAGANKDWNPAHFPDRAANGGMDYGPWLLNQCRQYELTKGERLLDVFSYHIYPQGANESGNDTSISTQLGRNRSTRALWDTNYVDESWINRVIELIPRMREWVASYYPGTKIGVTEYNWGAEEHISGATAQADILGIFGREGLDLATRWTTPRAGAPTFNAMKMYRNYDGNLSTFGDLSVSAAGPDPDNLSVFAAVRSSDAALTVMVINKQLFGAASANIELSEFLPAGTAQIWQLTAANTIARLSDLAFSAGTLSNLLPAQSITLFVLPRGSPPRLLNPVMATGNTFGFALAGQAGQSYVILESAELRTWSAVQTNSLQTNVLSITLPVTGSPRFYRAQRLP